MTLPDAVAELLRCGYPRRHAAFLAGVVAHGGYFLRRQLLAGGPTVILFEAAEIARTMRADCLRIRWALCEHVLDSPDDFASVREPSPPSGSAKREDDSARITIQGV